MQSTIRNRCPGCESCRPIPKRSGISYRHPDGPYRFRKTKPDGSVYEATGTLPEMLDEWAGHRVEPTKIVDAPSKRHQRISVEDYARRYYVPNRAATHPWSDSTRRRRESQIRVWLTRSSLGRMPIADVTRADVSTFLRYVASASSPRTGAVLAPKTIVHIADLVSGIMSDAAADGFRGPFTMPGLPKVRVDGDVLDYDRNDVAPPTADELRVLFRYMADHDDRDLCLVRVAVGTGMRLGELLALTWSAVDLDERTIQIRTSFSEVTRRVGPTKSRRSKRTIRISTDIAYCLAGHRELQTAGGKVVPIANLVYPSTRGTPRLGGNLRRRLDDVFAASGVDAMRAARGVPGLRFHDFRHYFVTDRIAAGRSAETIALYVGDRTKTIEDTYVHFWPSIADGVIDGIVDLASDAT